MICPICKKKTAIDTNVWLAIAYICGDHFVLHASPKTNEIFWYGIVIGDNKENQFRLTASRSYQYTKIIKNDTGQIIIHYDFYIDPEVENDMPNIEKIMNRVIRLRAFA